MEQKVFVEHHHKSMLEDGGASPEEEGDLVREYKAMHEEHFLFTWLREDMEGKAEDMEKASRESKEEELNSGKREVVVKGLLWFLTRRWKSVVCVWDVPGCVPFFFFRPDCVS